MNSSAPKARDHEWLDYYEPFPYFSSEAVRDGCQPRIMEHEVPAAKAIVLIHGLTDSPYFMTAIGTAAPSKPLVEANPQFQDMMEAIAASENSM